MARPIWTGVLTFGLVALPVGLYSATGARTIPFHQLQRGTSDRVRNRRVNERTGREVDFDDVVKGLEAAPGEYVIVEPEELEQIAPGRSKTIEISGFVDLAEVEPMAPRARIWKNSPSMSSTSARPTWTYTEGPA